MAQVENPKRRAVKTIVLVRHGRIVWRFWTLIPGYGLDAWRRGEDAAPLDTSYRPPPGAELEQLVRTAASIHASSLRRSIESARLLAPAVEPLIDARFREAELPAAIRSGVRLPAKVWAGVARARWFAGWGGTDGVESFREARSRAESAAAILEQYAESRGTVVLVGHGLMNILIAGHLRAAGWRGPRLPSQRHWGFDIYDGERLTTRSA
jgi:broad specificity phosphatase PhoE